MSSESYGPAVPNSTMDDVYRHCIARVVLKAVKKSLLDPVEREIIHSRIERDKEMANNEERSETDAV